MSHPNSHPNLVGERFGRLTVTAYSETKNQKRFWICSCDCGTTKSVSTDQLRVGKYMSCGCLAAEHRDQTTHGGSKTSEYNIWKGMKKRCENPRDHAYARYGGRGITVCERWQKFENFLEDMGQRPAGTSIDRFPDVDGSYQPSNCRWATQDEQQRNRRSTKLTPQLVTLIRELAAGGLSSSQVGRKVGISQTHACAVIARRSWGDVP